MESALVVSWAAFVALGSPEELSSGRSSSFCVRLRLTVPTTKIVDLSEDLRNRPVTVRVAKFPQAHCCVVTIGASMVLFGADCRTFKRGQF